MSVMPDQCTASVLDPGPLSEHDPLTDGELAILLAVPRGAEKTPDATLYRLPLGPDPTDSWVDVTFVEARSIIAPLTLDWKARLLHETDLSIGPGTTICLLVQPAAHAMLHWLAFWALGCTIQLVSLSMSNETIASYLNKSGCCVAVYSGISNAQVEGIRLAWNGTTIQLPNEEYAHQLTLTNKKGRSDSTLPWPKPQRPDPAIIVHSSGTTGIPKLLSFSLYFCTLNLRNAKTSGNSEVSDPRPYLILCPSYWSGFIYVFTRQLILGAPIAFAHILDFTEFRARHFMSWLKGLDVGGVSCVPRFLRNTLASGSEANISFLQGLAKITVSGSVLDGLTTALAEKYKLNLINVHGSTELGMVMRTSKPPYTHLRPGSRQVQFWFLPSTSARAAHLCAKGGFPLQLEPFPGEGSHRGELAIKLDDIFNEVQSDSELLYVYLGRSDDLIKLQQREGWGDFNASPIETELTSAVTSYLASQATAQWTLKALQIFGTNRPWADLVEHLSRLVQAVNEKLNMGECERVHPQKRMLIVTSDGQAHGPGAPDFGEEVPRLAVTHKHSLQRWRNGETFARWLDDHELDYSEP